MYSTPFDSSNRKKSSKSEWVFIEVLSRLHSEPLDLVEPLLRRARAPGPTVLLGLRRGVCDAELFHGGRFPDDTTENTSDRS
jgi:hypothetical protein